MSGERRRTCWKRESGRLKTWRKSARWFPSSRIDFEKEGLLVVAQGEEFGLLKTCSVPAYNLRVYRTRAWCDQHGIGDQKKDLLSLDAATLHPCGHDAAS